ncbi:DNA mismatch repair endonuclease MutL [candidate division WOR-3 bacterium]|nr:DNA mismatch repair endonuclease MutL [candidate division WOR-3 bacterium]
MHRKPVLPLPEEVVRRIAAGEVIVRPASVVKELIENSIDAGAKRIRLEIKAGGKNLIRVTDDGIGMNRDDVRQAVARYATSKLSSVDDLTRIQSYGFRGEALASIAAVSRMTIETNTDETQAGTRLEIEGGEIKELAEVAHPQGTTVTVKALFFNLPVRRAFLKSENYEFRMVAEAFRNYAIVFPEIGFELINNERLVVNLPPVGSYRERLLGLFDRKTVEGLVEFQVDNPVLSLHGFFSDPTQVKGFSDVQVVFFNRRPVRNQVVTRAVYDGYGPMPSGGHPNFVVFIQTEPSRLDVNIHPTKQEVRFADERFLFDFVSEAVRKGLGIQRRSQIEDTGLFVQERIIQDGEMPGEFWQLHNSYIFAQVASGYVIVDQHAAHERIIYEELLHRQQEAKPQGLLFPVTLDLSAEEFEAYDRIKVKLRQMGMETKVFSGRTVVVESVPAGSYMGKGEIREFFAELVKTSLEKATVERELAKLFACKGAVKAGQRLTQEEMVSLINRLFACREPYFCPHGRPVIIKITLEDLDRRFGRI